MLFFKNGKTIVKYNITLPLITATGTFKTVGDEEQSFECSELIKSDVLNLDLLYGKSSLSESKLKSNDYVKVLLICHYILFIIIIWL